MEFLDLARARRSVRSYTEQEVSDEAVRALLLAAQAAPSGGNRQPWHFFVIRNTQIRQQIVERSCKQPWLMTAPVWIAVCEDQPRTAERYGERGVTLYGIQDTAAAIQNMLLCAQSMGLGTCWCGAFDEAELSAILNLEPDMRPVAIVSVGYATASREMPARRDIEEITTFLP